MAKDNEEITVLISSAILETNPEQSFAIHIGFDTLADAEKFHEAFRKLCVELWQFQLSNPISFAMTIEP